MSGYLSGRTSLTTVQTGDIAADAVTAAKIADDVVNSEHLAAASIDNEHLADDAVNAAEIGALSAALDINGQELILDADADTSITADTDDQIDFKIAGADDFRMTANSMNVLSGSTLTIDSGATITNSGTATNFGVDPESAYAGVLETNANFVDQVIFGPSVDGKAWNGLWNKASLFSSLMLATIEDVGSDTQVNIWDLTQQSAGAISTTPLGTVTISGAATPTSIDASMGYVVVGTEDGLTVIDPHDGTWAERTKGWPRSLSTSTAPALGSNDVDDVAAAARSDGAYDPRTGGTVPDILLASSSSTTNMALYSDGTAGNSEVTQHKVTIWDRTWAVARETNSIRIGGGGIRGGGFALQNSGSTIAAMQDRSTEGMQTIGTGDHNVLASGPNDIVVSGQADGLNAISLKRNAGPVTTTDADGGMIAHISRTYNTGYMVGQIKGAWLANSKTADRSWKGNTLAETGTVVEAAVESGAELNGYNDFSASNYLTDAFDADFDFGTGSFSISCWAKANSTGSGEYWVFGRYSASHFFYIQYRGNDSDKFRLEVSDGSSALRVSTQGGNDDNTWHHIVGVFDSAPAGGTDEGRIYRDGVLEGTTVLAMNTVTDPDGQIGIGALPTGGSSAVGVTLALARISATVPSAAQIRQIYEAEKGMFAASAECLLQSSSTDAVLDVDVDPLTSKILVTQTDAITVFDGLVVDSKPTVNSGSSEKGKLFGDLRTEQNSANAYVTAPAVDQRQVNEMVRGLANEAPKGVDLSKAAAWIQFDGSGTVAIDASYNVKSLTDESTGQYTVQFGIPFATDAGQAMAGTASGDANGFLTTSPPGDNSDRTKTRIVATQPTATLFDPHDLWMIWFGELENE